MAVHSPGRPPWPLLAAAAVFLTSAAWATASPAQATTGVVQTDEIAHVVRPGDTLEGLAATYLDAPRLWPLLQARNKLADARRLKPGSVVWIPVRLQPQSSATVDFVQGTATARGPGAASAAALAAGQKLEEGTALTVAPDAFVTVTLADGTVVRIQSQSDVVLRQLRRRGRAGSVQAVLEMRSGAVESAVQPAAGPRRFEVRTPLAITSVRGTRFGIAMGESGQTIASVLEGAVGVQARDAAAPAGRPTDTSAGVALASGQGLAVAADGTLGLPRALLAAPDVSQIPEMVSDAGILALSVPAMPGALRYEAQVARDEAFRQVLRQGRFTHGELRFRALEDGRYHLMVRALDDAGIAGLPATRAFTVKTQPAPPLYQQPAPGAVVAAGASALECTEVAGARWYRLQVAKDAAFSSIVRDEPRLAECRLGLDSLAKGSYFWRAASVAELPGGASDQGPFAPPQAFTVADRPPAMSANAMDANDGGTRVSLHWPAQPGQRFRLQLAPAAQPDFKTLVQDTELDSPSWAAGDLPAGEYLVRIQVLDPTGLQSDFSPARKVRVGTGLSTGFGLPLSTQGGDPVRRP
ncbi:MAG: FecR domain-containing protein [Acidovorax sp.]|nr:FecR domain-containing protein [Acidovorax sp.]